MSQPASLPYASPSDVRPRLTRAPWLSPDAPARLGLLINPFSRQLKGAMAARRQLAQLVPDALLSVESSSPDEARAAIRHLVAEGVNVLAIAGGDGSIHLAINTLIALAQEAHARCEQVALPALLPLRTGTLNIIAHSAGPRPDPRAALASIAKRCHEGAPLAALSMRKLPLLRVERPDAPAVHGCIFGSEMVKNALELYDRFGGGYEGLSRFLFEAARGYLFNTSLWKQEGWRMTPPPFGLSLTGPSAKALPVGAYAAAVASTVDLAIAGGSIRTLRRAPEHEGFFARIITEARTGPLLKLIPALMREAKLDEVVDEPEATALELHGAFTLDGECYGTSSKPPALPSPLRVYAASESVRVIFG